MGHLSCAAVVLSRPHANKTDEATPWTDAHNTLLYVNVREKPHGSCSLFGISSIHEDRIATDPSQDELYQDISFNGSCVDLCIAVLIG